MNPALGEQNARLAPEEIADLGRWWVSWFDGQAVTMRALTRYRCELERQQAQWRAAGLGS